MFLGRDTDVLSQPSEEAAAIDSPEVVKAILEKDFAQSYFVTGKSPDCKRDSGRRRNPWL